jgi:hypothetical protein
MSDRKQQLAEKYLDLARSVGGCGDGGCVVIQRTGMHTNGGCQCTLNADPMRQRGIRSLLMMAQHLAKDIINE